MMQEALVEALSLVVWMKSPRIATFSEEIWVVSRSRGKIETECHHGKNPWDVYIRNNPRGELLKLL